MFDLRFEKNKEEYTPHIDIHLDEYTLKLFFVLSKSNLHKCLLLQQHGDDIIVDMMKTEPFRKQHPCFSTKHQGCSHPKDLF